MLCPLTQTEFLNKNKHNFGSSALFYQIQIHEMKSLEITCAVSARVMQTFARNLSVKLTQGKPALLLPISHVPLSPFL